MLKAILVLCFGAAQAGKYDKSFDVSVRDTAVSSLEAMNFEGTIQTQMRDQLQVGAEYEQRSASFKPRSLFARWTSKEGNPLSVKTSYNLGDNAAELEVEYEHSGTNMELDVDTSRKNWIKRVALARKFDAKGRDLSVNPEYDFDTKTATLISRLSLNADTDLELNLESDDIADRNSLGASLEIEHSINDNNSIRPKFNLNSGDVSYEYKRKLSADANLVANVNPGKDINLEWEDTGSRGLWTTNVNVPWGEAEGTSLSVKRKFEF